MRSNWVASGYDPELSAQRVKEATQLQSRKKMEGRVLGKQVQQVTS